MSTSSNRPKQGTPVITFDELRLSRRTVVQGSSLAAAAITSSSRAFAQSGTPGATPGGSDVVPRPTGPAVLFFSPLESMVVEALTARILPGSPEDPGAREAGVVFYIDRMLSGNNDGLSVMTYSQGPFMEVTEVEATVESTSRTDIYETIQVAPELASRYGYQSALTPQEIYRRGVLSVIAHVDAVYGVPFENLTEAQHDEIVEAMFADEAEGFDAPSGRAFFTKLRNDTIEGMFSDPMYGGNREMVGWRLIGYPGVRGHYSHSDMLDPAFHAEPVSLADMAEHGH